MNSPVSSLTRVRREPTKFLFSFPNRAPGLSDSMVLRAAIHYAKGNTQTRRNCFYFSFWRGKNEPMTCNSVFANTNETRKQKKRAQHFFLTKHKSQCAQRSKGEDVLPVTTLYRIVRTKRSRFLYQLHRCVEENGWNKWQYRLIRMLGHSLVRH